MLILLKTFLDTFTNERKYNLYKNFEIVSTDNKETMQRIIYNLTWKDSTTIMGMSAHVNAFPFEIVQIDIGSEKL